MQNLDEKIVVAQILSSFGRNAGRWESANFSHRQVLVLRIPYAARSPLRYQGPTLDPGSVCRRVDPIIGSSGARKELAPGGAGGVSRKKIQKKITINDKQKTAYDEIKHVRNISSIFIFECKHTNIFSVDFSFNHKKNIFFKGAQNILSIFSAEFEKFYLYLCQKENDCSSFARVSRIREEII